MEISSKNLFAIKVMEVKDCLNNKQIGQLKNIVKDIELQIEPHGWNCNVETSFKDKNQHLDSWLSNNLSNHILNYITEIVKLDKNKSLNIDAWINKYGQGMYQEQHNHSNIDVLLCGILYLQVPKDNTAYTHFFDPIETLKRQLGEPVQSVQIDSEENTLILFPPYLQHLVTKQKSQQHRITVSFNVVCG